MSDLFILFQRAKSHPDVFAAAAAEFASQQVPGCLRRLNLRPDPALVDDVTGDVVAAVGEAMPRLLRGGIHNIAGYLVTLAKREVAHSVDWYLRIVGPTGRTRQRRLAAGREEFLPWEPRTRQPYLDESAARADGRGIPGMFLAQHRETMPDEYWLFLGAVRELAWACADGELRKALGLIETAERPNISEVARLCGMRRQTLRDQLDRLGQKIIDAAPEGVREAGAKYWRGWAVKSDGSALSIHRRAA